MPIYKVSYVDHTQPGGGTITSQRTAPQVGEVVVLRSKPYRVIEVIELIPPRGGVHFLHATVEPTEEKTPPDPPDARVGF